MDSIEVAADGNSSSDSSQPQTSRVSAPGSKGNPAPKKATVRKRTKTGCLTCRKRRIKCDEGKPICNNCIKSKRQCEGYNQRLTFKEPLGAYPNGPMYGHPVYHAHHQQPHDAMLSTHHHHHHHPAQHAKAASSQGPLPMLAPKAPSTDFTSALPPQFGHPYHGQPGSSLPVGHGPSPPIYGPQHPYFANPPLPNPGAAPSYIHAQPQHFLNEDMFSSPTSAQAHIESGRTFGPPISGQQRPSIAQTDPLVSPTDIRPQYERTVSSEEGYWDPDDEASMGESDDEILPDNNYAQLESNELGIQVVRHMGNAHDHFGMTRMRTFSGFIDETVLETYTPSSGSSPINDPQTAAVFWYFVNVTGPSMSLYERHPLDPSPMFQGQPVPKARQHIWTYTFPIMSFHHPALMQAMLALGSLQMAKLHNMPPTAAMKHYHLSLRRIAKNYQSPNRRTQPATLAATLLLGFYEVWNSDHDKWCKHMWGARAILREIPLQEMTREILALKQRRRQSRQRITQSQYQHQQQHRYNDYYPEIFDDDNGDALDGIDNGEVDSDLIFHITGRHVNYYEDELAQDPRRPSLRQYTDRDIETYKHLSDLFWWYCKMDVYQSVLGGTRLFMEYDKWTQCAPRAPFGRIDAIYGTFDHLMLLLGRLASFASQDLARKRKARRAEQQQQQQQQQQSQSQTNLAAPRGPQGSPPPMFPGLLPSNGGRFTKPPGFSPPRHQEEESSPASESAEEMDLEASTAVALSEWESIRVAFETFRNQLGPDFDPMGPEHEPPEYTPFGRALKYRTFSIAGIWMNYFMGLIVLYRAHPSMPPVAVVAAGMAAKQTAPWAIQVGRIAAGLHEDCAGVPAVSTVVGAAFIESCFCLFVAGIQYQEQEQRHWTIRRLHDIARLTGWQSARQIADGCESAWTKAAQVGRGPPYERASDLQSILPRSVWVYSPRRLDIRIRESQMQPDSDAGGGGGSGGSAGGAGGGGLGERRLVLARTEQAHYALGLLSVEQDLEKLDLGEEAD